MKKILAMLLALTTAASLAVTAVADPSPAESRSVDSITFESDANGVDLSGSVVLTPGQTYRFPVSYTPAGGEKAPLSAEQFKGLKFRFANDEGKRAIDTMRIEKFKGDYHLVINTKQTWSTELTEVAYTITATDTKDSGKSISVQNVSFQVGYLPASADSLRDPDYVIVDPAAPVLTEDDLDYLNDLADGEDITFTYGDWEFTVPVKNLKDINMFSDDEEIEAIVNQYPNQLFKFVNFPGEPTFRTTGVLNVKVSDVAEDYLGTFFVYRFDNNKLTKMPASYDHNTGLLSIGAKQLGRFVITNREIKNAIVNGSTGENSNPNGNPSTGASDLAGLSFTGMALALTLAGLGIARKR